MPMPLRSLRDKRAELKLEEFPDLKVVHNPNAYTPALEVKITELMKDDSAGRFLANILPELITEWDLIDEDGEFGTKGESVPITTESMMKLPTELLTAISNAIHKAHAPFATSQS